MFGYVRPVLDELDEKEKNRFQAVYCGLCYELGNRYGLAARFLLNYDYTFLAILLSDQEEDCASYRCPCKGFRCKERLQSSKALEIAADDSIILTYWKLQDEVKDGTFWKRLGSRFLRLLFHGAYRKAKKRQPEFCETVQKCLSQLQEMENEHIESIDRPADMFAKILMATAKQCGTERQQKVHEQMLYHLGRWIYLIDALDDLKEDSESGNYNPLAARYHLRDGILDEENRKRLVATLDHSVNMITSAYVFKDSSPWSKLIENVIYIGLPIAGRLVLEGKWDTAVGSRMRLCKKAETFPERMESNL